MGKTLVKHFDPLWLSIAITNENCKSVFQDKMLIISCQVFSVRKIKENESNLFYYWWHHSQKHLNIRYLSVFSFYKTYEFIAFFSCFLVGFRRKGKPRVKPKSNMNATVKVLCYKSKTLANGENPLMIRVSKNGKKSYKSLGISINPIYWDFKENKPKRNCPHKEQIENLIVEKLKAFNQTILELNVKQKEYTSDSLINKVEKPFKLKTVKDIFLEQIEFLETSKRKRYAESCKTVYNSLIDFNEHLNIFFSDIDTVWLKKYEAWLRNKNLAENTIGIRFRTLRVMYNVAIEEKCVNPQLYPFRSYKVSKLKKDTAKRALTKSDIKRIINHKASNEREQLSLDIFIFSYLMGGINFVDIASLTKDNIINNQLVYTRKKTGKLIKLPIHTTARKLIDKYHNSENSYLFPILFSYHKTEQQKANRVHKIIGKTNKDLKEIGKTLKLPITLTTYVARHSFATVLKRSGVKTSVISESLGHSSERVTQFYLDSFENDKLKESMQYLL